MYHCPRDRIHLVTAKLSNTMKMFNLLLDVWHDSVVGAWHNHCSHVCAITIETCEPNLQTASTATIWTSTCFKNANQHFFFSLTRSLTTPALQAHILNNIYQLATTAMHSIDLMPDKSLRGMRPDPVTALCISYAFPDCIRTLCKLFPLLWSATYVDFFLLALFWNTPTSCKCVYLPEFEKGVTLKQL